MPQKAFQTTHTHKNLYGIACLLAIGFFFIHRIFAAGFLVGLLLGVGNGLLLTKQFGSFLQNKKLYLVFLSYIIRYFSLGLILYLAVKKDMILFYGIIAGFAAAQAVFFVAQLKNLGPKNTGKNP